MTPTIFLNWSAFSTPHDHYESDRMPFGLKTALAIIARFPRGAYTIFFASREKRDPKWWLKG